MTLSNTETAEQVRQLGIHKAHYHASKTFTLGVMGGVYIALGALGSLLANYHIGGGMGKFVGAAIFPTGLMLTVLVGGSLFTGDVLGMLALKMGKTRLMQYLRGIIMVWLGNFVGASFIALVSYLADSYTDAQFSAMIVHLVEHKLHLSPLTAIASGFLCNVLVAIAVWFALASSQMSAKILAIWFPITLFVFAGFQHCVANMFYVNLGLLLDGSLWNTASYTSHFLWVTLGNFLSGGLFLPLIYSSLYLKKS
ncbi:MAG: formate/nitrite transporter family protein [Akkermansia sp.]